MTDGNEVRRKRLLYQSNHRGTKEADLILGGFARSHLGGMSTDQLTQFDALLNESDPDLMDWIGKGTPPERLRNNSVIFLIFEFKNSLLSD